MCTGRARSHCKVIAGVSALCAVLLAGPVIAAEARAEGAFKPTFKVTPLVHQFEASAGGVIDFRFDVSSSEPRALKVEPVAMVQQDNGQVMPDEASPRPEVIRMISPSELRLSPDRPQQIHGRLTVPNTGSGFQAYAILVTDLGPPDSPEPPADEGATVLGVRFVTRYMLRIDVTVRGVFGDGGRKLELTDGQLIDRAGRAVVQAFVHNPMPTPFEFEARCRIFQSHGAPLGPAFMLAMPTRMALAEKYRYRTRILNLSRVRVIAPLPEPIMPGDYEMEIELLVGGRPVVIRRFSLTVTPEQFPAQAAVVAQIIGDVLVSPTQLELSVRPRGNRIVPLRLTNRSSRPVTVQLAPVAAPDESVDWFVVRPEVIALGAGASRNAMITLRGGGDADTHRYASLRVRVEPDDGGVGGYRDVRVALVTRADTAVRLIAEVPRWSDAQQPASFIMPVYNEGSIHVPLQATLTLTDTLGRSIELTGGFGRWLLPGQSDVIRFPAQGAIPPGQYVLRAELRTAPGDEPLRFRQDLHIPRTADGTTSPPPR